MNPLLVWKLSAIVLPMIFLKFWLLLFGVDEPGTDAPYGRSTYKTGTGAHWNSLIFAKYNYCRQWCYQWRSLNLGTAFWNHCSLNHRSI
ncbi:unnamed protein product [Cunninghamella echinulata]